MPQAGVQREGEGKSNSSEKCASSSPFYACQAEYIFYDYVTWEGTLVELFGGVKSTRVLAARKRSRENA